MKSHSPALDTNTQELSGKTMCGKGVQWLNITSDEPTCGQCARNLRTIAGIMRDGRQAFARFMAEWKTA